MTEKTDGKTNTLVYVAYGIMTIVVILAFMSFSMSEPQVKQNNSYGAPTSATSPL